MEAHIREEVARVKQHGALQQEPEQIEHWHEASAPQSGGEKSCCRERAEGNLVMDVDHRERVSREPYGLGASEANADRERARQGKSPRRARARRRRRGARAALGRRAAGASERSRCVSNRWRPRGVRGRGLPRERIASTIRRVAQSDGPPCESVPSARRRRPRVRRPRRHGLERCPARSGRAAASSALRSKRLREARRWKLVRASNERSPAAAPHSR